MNTIDIDEIMQNEIAPLETNISSERSIKRALLKELMINDLLASRCLTLEKQSNGFYNMMMADNEAKKLTNETINQLRTELALKTKHIENLQNENTELTKMNNTQMMVINKLEKKRK